VEHFNEKCHASWMEDLGNVDTEGLNVPEKISDAVAMRLMKQSDVISTWPQALALQALPSNVPAAIAGLARTCDTACNLAGPAPVDVYWFRYVCRHPA